MSDETDPYRTQSRNGKRARRGPSSANIITELSTANSLIVNMQRAVIRVVAGPLLMYKDGETLQT